MIITWNGVYEYVGDLNIGSHNYGIYTNSVERCSLIYHPVSGIVYQSDWSDQGWRTLVHSKNKKDLEEIVNEYQMGSKVS